MNLSKSGEDFIKQWEHLELVPYYDEAGFLTAGWGHKFSPVNTVPSSHTLTLETAEQYFKEDVAIAENCLNKNLVLGPNGEEYFDQNEFDALTAFVFNIGTKNFLNSHVFGFLKSDLIDSLSLACEWWQKWCHDRNPVTHEEETSQGLVNRRAAEVKLFETGQYV